MKHANILKKELGMQLALLRLKKRRTIQSVAKDLAWKEHVVDQIENGYHHTWKLSYELLKYYHGEIGIILNP